VHSVSLEQSTLPIMLPKQSKSTLMVNEFLAGEVEHPTSDIGPKSSGPSNLQHLNQQHITRGTKCLPTP